MSTPDPLVIAAAPNGARKTPQDHPALPVTADQLADTAATCQQAGAAMFHLHVRDAEGRHSLDPRHYARATDAIRASVGDRLVIQATSESGGVYGPSEQLDAMRALAPESVSLAVREAIGRSADEAAAAEFLAWARRQGVAVQYILYDRTDLARYHDLVARGVIPGARHWLLFVLGSYAQGRDAAPAELLGFVDADWPGATPWMVCAFGPREAGCALTAAGLGGQVRVGFENNLQLPDGRTAPDNAALVANVAAGARALGRPPASADALRAQLAGLARE
ncbi:MAG: 3-keto-5-aminohexanoate cleavage protein [Rhodovibrio sp.]|nr:3-keto-5-aminohexanoate cleavage protein [Rhodovibrio sp.]